MKYWSRQPITDGALRVVVKNLACDRTDEPEDSDFLLHSVLLRNPSQDKIRQVLRDDVEAARVTGRKLVVIVLNDAEGPYHALDDYAEKVLVFRTSVSKATQRAYEMVMPYVFRHSEVLLGREIARSASDSRVQ